MNHKKIVLFLDSEPYVGGAFQYNQTIVEAVSALPKNKYNVVIVYTSKIWEQYLSNQIEKIYIPFSRTRMNLIQLLIMSWIPLDVIRIFINKLHPISKAIFNHKPDLCIYPSQETFWGYITKVPYVGAIHDLMHKYEKQFNEVSGFGKYIHKEKHFKNICKYAKGILVDSNLGKHHVYDSYSFPLDKIFILPYVPPHYIFENKTTSNNDRKYILPTKYIFYPSQFWQHKNHKRLIEAIHSLRNEIPDIKLILAGSKKHEYVNISRMVKDLNLEGVVHFIGYVPENDLAEIYKKATALVVPTFFGPTNIPPLEAFSMGCPVAVSNVYGMPEQVGDAGLLFDPKNVADIANAIKRLWLEDDLRNQLIQSGYERASKWGQSEFNNKFKEILECISIC
jgi:glycosyltransferase involved in cell wall biosynthesis